MGGKIESGMTTAQQEGFKNWSEWALSQAK